MKNVLLAAILLIFGTLSCNKPVVACIEADATSVAVGTPVQFTSCSEKSLSFTWFMTGPIGAPENNIGWSEESFSNTFTVPGNYTIELTAYKNYSWTGENHTTTTSLVIN